MEKEKLIYEKFAQAKQNNNRVTLPTKGLEFFNYITLINMII